MTRVKKDPRYRETHLQIYLLYIPPQAKYILMFILLIIWDILDLEVNILRYQYIFSLLHQQFQTQNKINESFNVATFSKEDWFRSLGLGTTTDRG